MRDFCFYFFYRAGSALLAALPLPFLFRLGQGAGFCAWLVLPHYRKLALHNATLAFASEKPPGELRQLVRRHFCQLGANLLCSIKIAAMPIAKIEQHIDIENLDIIHRQLRAGRPVVLILSHLGNWELCAQILPKFIGYVRNSTIYQRLGNRLIDEHVRKARARAGVEMFDRKEGFQKAIELLRGGGAIGILSDQHAGDQGLWVPFFGKLASTSPLPALLAKRTNAALVGIAFYTNGVARWRIVVGPMLEPKGDSVESLTAKANELIAHQIRLAPDDWFWVHNRWKTPRPNFSLHLKGVIAACSHSGTISHFVSSSGEQLAGRFRDECSGRASSREVAGCASRWPRPPRLAIEIGAEVDEIIPLPDTSIFANVRSILREQPFDVAILFQTPCALLWKRGWRGFPVESVIAATFDRGYSIKSSGNGRSLDESTSGGTLSPDCPRSGGRATQKGFDVRSLRRTWIIGRSRSARGGVWSGETLASERFAAAACAITGERPVEWILFGTTRYAALGKTISAALGDRCVNRIGQTTLDQLIGELRACRLLLTNDTGTMHLASLLGLPTVAIFGSTEPQLTGPLGNSHVVLRHHVECSPCFLRECPIDFRCMRRSTLRKSWPPSENFWNVGRAFVPRPTRRKSGR
jgi:lauroyl/myristoyl acyltransferase